MKEIKLDIEKFGTYGKLNIELLRDMEVKATNEFADDFIKDMVTVLVTKHICVEKRVQEKMVSYLYPKNWIHLLIADHAPIWIKKLFKPEFICKQINVRFEEKFLYPTLPAKEHYKQNVIYQQ